MSYKHFIRFKLEQDYYIDSVTYRWTGDHSAKIEARFYTDKPLDEQKALLFVLAWYILSRDKNQPYVMGWLILKSYSDVKLSVEEVERSDESVLYMDDRKRDRISICEPDVVIEEIIKNWALNTDDKELSAKLTAHRPTDEELMKQIFKRAQVLRTGGM